MLRKFGLLQAIVAVLVALSVASGAMAQKAGGILKVYSLESPPGVSILEGISLIAPLSMMGVFNNLVLFDQHVKQDSLESIVPDLASTWSWNEDGTELTFKLRQGVSWHDGKPFSARDVQCTWDLILEKSSEKLRVNPRKSWYRNLDRLTTNGDYEMTFHLKHPQPAFLMLLAGGYAPIYPCHVSPNQMRQHPIGTGPFKFVEFKPNEHITVRRNPDYWKPGRPYIDGIEYTIIRNLSTAVLAFTSGKVDMTFPGSLTIPLLRDVQMQIPEADCEAGSGAINATLLINRERAPFNQLDLRRALALSLDRKSFVDILSEGRGEIGGVLQPLPDGLWGMPPEMLKSLPGYDPDVSKNRAEARAIMEKLGYGPDNKLKVKVLTYDLPFARAAAVILIDQLKKVYVEGELDPVEPGSYLPKILRKDFTIVLGGQLSGPDPDPILDLHYGCGSVLNWDGYCNPEVDKMIEQQSMEPDRERRKQLVWAIERKLAEDVARPIIFYSRSATCRRPYVKNLTLMVNSPFNSWRFEDVWLDR
jgi:peptide/nickel transport system substrate-binding protein